MKLNKEVHEMKLITYWSDVRCDIEPLEDCGESSFTEEERERGYVVFGGNEIKATDKEDYKQKVIESLENEFGYIGDVVFESITGGE
jgi:hypothetical protein